MAEIGWRSVRALNVPDFFCSGGRKRRQPSPFFWLACRAVARNKAIPSGVCPPSLRLPRDSPERFKSGAARIHALIRSLDSAQNGELSLPIETRLPSQSSTVYASLCVRISPDYARSVVHSGRALRRCNAPSRYSRWPGCKRSRNGSSNLLTSAMIREKGWPAKP